MFDRKEIVLGNALEQGLCIISVYRHKKLLQVMFPNPQKLSFLTRDSISSAVRTCAINLAIPRETWQSQVKKEKLKKRYFIYFSLLTMYCELLTSVFRHCGRHKPFCIQPEMQIWACV